jgi:hypothetical protein
VTTDKVTVSLWLPQNDGTYNKVGEIGTWLDLALEPRYAQPGTWSLSLPISTQGLAITPQHVVTFDFRSWRMTGLIEKPPAPARDEDGKQSLDVSGLDALSLLGHYLCYPDPDSGPAAQLKTHYKDEGAAEDVLRRVIKANVIDRAGEPLHIPASAGRGGDVKVKVAFKSLLDVVVRKAKRGSIGIRCGLENTTSSTRAEMWLRFSEPTDRSARIILAPDVGALKSWKSEKTAPTGTVAIVAGAQDDTVYTIGSVSTSSNTLTISGGGDARHHFKTGSRIAFRGNGNPPAPIDLGADYFAIRVDANTFKIAQSRAKALNGNEISLTSSGSGTLKVSERSRGAFEVVDAGAVAIWGRREVFVDDRNEDDDQDTTYEDAGREALDDGAAQTSFEIDVVEPAGMKWVDHFSLGDTVTVSLLPQVSSTTYLGAVRLQSTPDAGTTVQLVPGDPDNAKPLFKQAALIRALRQQVRALQEDA